MPFVINFTWLIYVSFLTFDTLSIGLLGVMIPPPESGTCFTTRLFVRIVRSKLPLFSYGSSSSLLYRFIKGGMNICKYLQYKSSDPGKCNM